jgi:hypothetical protein
MHHPLAPPPRARTYFENAPTHQIYRKRAVIFTPCKAPPTPPLTPISSLLFLIPFKFNCFLIAYPANEFTQKFGIYPFSSLSSLSFSGTE